MRDEDRFDALIAGLEQSGYTRTDIATATGLSRQTIWRFANGMARDPKHDTAVRIKNFAEVHSVTPMLQK